LQNDKYPEIVIPAKAGIHASMNWLCCSGPWLPDSSTPGQASPGWRHFARGSWATSRMP